MKAAVGRFLDSCTAHDLGLDDGKQNRFSAFGAKALSGLLVYCRHVRLDGQSRAWLSTAFRLRGPLLGTGRDGNGVLVDLYL